VGIFVMPPAVAVHLMGEFVKLLCWTTPCDVISV
jgi:hypothetical protein